MRKQILLIFLFVLSVWSARLFAQSSDFEFLAESGSYEGISEAFSNKKFSSQVFGSEKETFLMLALKNGRSLKIIDLCLENGSSVKAKSKSGKNPLMYACQFSSDENIIERLIKTSGSKKKQLSLILQEDSEGLCSFSYARMNPNYKVYLKLSEYTDDPEGFYIPPEKEIELPELLEVEEEEESEKGFEIPGIGFGSDEESQSEIKDYASIFLLDYAEDSESEDEKEERELIENPNAADQNGVTLLMKAAKAGNDWDVDILLKSGADVNMRDKDGWTALMYAARYQNNLNVVNRLIEGGCLIREKNKFGVSPLLMAAYYSQNPDIIACLLKNRSASEDEVLKAFIFSITGTTSTEHVILAKVKLFLDMGVPLNIKWKGQTPLMYAAKYGKSTELLKQLLDLGAKTDVTDDDGKTAFDYAKENKKLEHDDIFWSLNATE